MRKINVIYWSGTGNTEMMAEAIFEGLKKAGVETNLIKAENATVDQVKECEAVILGCSSMGNEVLEESIMEPFMESIDGEISGKRIALFGSYGWGDGQWMREWEERIEENRAILFEEGLMINETPDEAGLKLCKEFGERVAK